MGIDGIVSKKSLYCAFGNYNLAKRSTLVTKLTNMLWETNKGRKLNSEIKSKNELEKHNQRSKVNRNNKNYTLNCRLLRNSTRKNELIPQLPNTHGPYD